MDTFRILFPEVVNSVTFEKTLLEFHSSTKKTSVNQVFFDFSRVVWCELFELTLIVVWIRNLCKRKKIIFVYPNCYKTDNEKDDQFALKRQQVCSFLNRWNFDEFLFTNKIEISGYEQNYLTWKSNFNQDSTLPIEIFYEERDFKEFI